MNNENHSEPTGTPAAPLTPQAAQAEIDRLSTEKDFVTALLGQRGFGPAYRAATARWTKLNIAAAKGKTPR